MPRKYPPTPDGLRAKTNIEDDGDSSEYLVRPLMKPMRRLEEKSYKVKTKKKP